MSIRSIDSYEANFKRGIKEILEFAKLLSQRYAVFSNDVQNIESLYKKELFISSEGNVYKNYSDNDLEIFRRFLKRLLTDRQFINSYFKIVKETQLHELWNLLENLSPNVSMSDIVLSSTTGILKSENMDKKTLLDEIRKNDVYKDLIQRNRIALLDCNNDINEIISNLGRNRLIIKTLFSIMITTRETHHYTLLTILNEAKNRASLPYDIEQLCSVENKVARDKGWVTDIIAIRNCIGHFHYEVFDNLSIQFKNKDHGYNYERLFTFEEFLSFFQDFYRLMLIQQKSLSIVNLIQRLQIK